MESSQNKPQTLRKWRIFKHHRNQWKSLLRGTIPILVAATISRAISQFLELLVGSGDIRMRIVIEMLYTVLVAHIFGYIVNLWVPTTNPLFQYYLTLATDNASFAWSSTITLIVLKSLYSAVSIWIAVMVWVLMVLTVCFIIYLVNYLQEVHFRLSTTDRRSNIRIFESECFSLSIAYALTVIIAVSLYHNESTDYLSNTDDINPTNDDNSSKNDLNWVFFVYVCIVTVLMFSYQAWMNRRIKRRKMKEVARVLIERSSFSGNSPEFSSEIEISKATNRWYQDPDWIEKIEDYFHSLYHRVMFWDQDRQGYIAFCSFYYTTIAYSVACGWYMWSILTFQNLFHFEGGPLVGLLIYAFASTFLVASILTILSLKEEYDGLRIETHSQGESKDPNTVSSQARNKLEKKSILYYAFARLTIGLAWQQFFNSCATALIPQAQTDRSGLAAMTKLLVAILLFLLGRSFELWLKTRKSRPPSTDSAPLLPGTGDSVMNMNINHMYDLLDADEEYEEPLL